MNRKEKPPAGRKLIGRWRIIAANLWDKDYWTSSEVCGAGDAHLHDDSSMEIDFAYRHGDKVVLQAVKIRVLQQPARRAG
ncbi:MAG: hypothetical protein HXY23_00085 [Parvularculaceae bacterium]|jgi:hypothetical protein|nr:hypothetical protein [Parvularculaceae bacterium]